MLNTILRIRDFVPAGGFCHVAASRMSGLAQAKPEQPSRAQPPTPVHGHDFHEVFWLDSGRGRHLLGAAGRHSLPLERGTVALVAAGDVHGFAPVDARGFRLVNVAFHTELWRGLRTRYGRELPELFAGPANVRQRALDAAAFATLQAAAQELAAGARTRVATERFLLNLAALLAERPRAPGAPAWLNEVPALVRSPAVLSGGTPALAARLGFSAEHVARSVVKHLGATPTRLLTEARLQAACARLLDGDEAVLAIALACGFGSLGHFYRCFRGRFQASPERWRQAQRSILSVSG